MKSRQITIGFKLITITSLILLISLIGVGYLAGLFFQRDTVTRIQEVTAEKSQLLSYKINSDVKHMMNQAQQTALMLMKSQTKAEALPSAERELMIRALRSAPELLYVGVYKRSEYSARITEDILNPASGIEEGNIEKFRQMNNMASYMVVDTPPAPFFYNSMPLKGIPSIAVCFPLAYSGPNAEYQIVAYLAQRIFTDAIANVSEYQTYIVNHIGDLLAHPDIDLLAHSISFQNNQIVEAMLTSPIDNGQMTYTDPDGVVQIGSFYKMEIGSLGIVSTARRDKLLEAVYQIRRRNYYITAIVLSISVLILYIFSKTISQPVKRLVAATMEVERGNFQLKIRPSTKDEIGDLTWSFSKMVVGLDERDKIKDALGKFVNKEIAELAAKGQISLGGERKEAAVFFSDIRSFTAISESLSPEEVVEFLNEYMSAMVDCVENTFGVVDKFIGDAVMAVWGAPISHGNDTENAVDTALMMRKALEEFNIGRGGERKPIIKIGSGINTGPVIAGQIGSENHMEYTVIGDAVNLASRIEGLNKPFGTDILISEHSYALVEGIYHVAAMPPIKVKGKSKPVHIYAVLGRRDDPNAMNNIDQLRRYLGTEDVDTSQFDGEGKEEKFGPITKEPKAT